MTTRRNRVTAIPAKWRRAVIDALRSGAKERVIKVVRAQNDWASTFPAAWEHDWHDALIAALSAEAVSGRRIEGMEPPCEAYAFWFTFDDTKLYGKIGLLPNGTVIIIFSTHIPLKGDTL